MLVYHLIIAAVIVNLITFGGVLDKKRILRTSPPRALINGDGHCSQFSDM